MQDQAIEGIQIAIECVLDQCLFVHTNRFVFDVPFRWMKVEMSDVIRQHPHRPRSADGEQDHFPNAAAACEEHHQPVHADSKTTGGGIP